MNIIETNQETSKSFLSLKLKNKLFTSHIAHVNNTIEVLKKMPDTPDYFIGILNLCNEITSIQHQIKSEYAS